MSYRPLMCSLCIASIGGGGRRLAVRTAMEHPIGALPRTPFPASRDFPSRGNERYEEKTASHILQVPFRRFPPLVAGATTLPGGKHVTGFAGRLQLPYESSSFATPASGGTIKSSVMLRGAYESTAFQSFILSPGWGKVRRSRIGGVICRRQIIQQNGYFVI